LPHDRRLDRRNGAAYPNIMSDSDVAGDLDDEFIHAQDGEYEPEDEPLEDDERSIDDDLDEDSDDEFPDDDRIVVLDDDPDDE
jgi:hypothetical protein